MVTANVNNLVSIGKLASGTQRFGQGVKRTLVVRIIRVIVQKVVPHLDGALRRNMVHPAVYLIRNVAHTDVVRRIA